MATERFGIIKVGGMDATVIGDDVTVGQAAPEFTAHALDWSLVRGLADTKGKVRILASVPSLEYVAYMPSNSNEPNYEEVLEAAKKAL